MVGSLGEPAGEVERWRAHEYADCVRIEHGRDEHGRAIVTRSMFASRAIPADTLIEKAPVVPIYGAEHFAMMTVAIKNYSYKWLVVDEFDARGDDKLPVVVAGLALGYAAVYNHAVPPQTANVVGFSRARDFVLELRTTQDVEDGDELLSDYGWPSSENENRLGPVDAFLRPAADLTLKVAHDTTWRSLYERR